MGPNKVGKDFQGQQQRVHKLRWEQAQQQGTRNSPYLLFPWLLHLRSDSSFTFCRPFLYSVFIKLSGKQWKGAENCLSLESNRSGSQLCPYSYQLCKLLTLSESQAPHL